MMADDAGPRSGDAGQGFLDGGASVYTISRAIVVASRLR
jgi:hypothetical protein